MGSTLKLALAGAAVGLAAVAGVFTAFAAPAAPSSPAFLPAAAPRAWARAGLPAGCDQMQASAIAWVTLTPNHHVDKQVPSYASGSSDITPLFQFNCIPDNTTIVTVFSLNGQTVFSDKEAVPARTTGAMYAYDLETNDGSPLADGQWGVQYFANQTPLTDGTVTVGKAGNGDPSQTSKVTLQGVIQDKDSQSPIQGATVLIMNPGTKVQDYLNNGAQRTDVFTAGQSDSQGNFTLHDKLDRHQTYSMLITVEGYKPLGNDTFQINDEPDPVSITVGMSK